MTLIGHWLFIWLWQKPKSSLIDMDSTLWLVLIGWMILFTYSSLTLKGTVNIQVSENVLQFILLNCQLLPKINKKKLNNSLLFERNKCLFFTYDQLFIWITNNFWSCCCHLMADILLKKRKNAYHECSHNQQLLVYEVT